MIERNILDNITESLGNISTEVSSIHDELIEIEYEYDDIVGTEITTDFDSSNLEEVKEKIQTTIINLQNLITEIDDLDL